MTINNNKNISYISSPHERDGDGQQLTSREVSGTGPKNIFPMDTHSPISQNSLTTDLKTLAGTLLLTLLLCFGILILFFIFWWDALSSNPFSETGPTELIQTIVLAISTTVFFLEAHRCPDMRGGFVLVAGFIGCMLIREQDYFLDSISHGCWKWPALVLAVSCLTYAATTLRTTLAGLARLTRWQYFSVLIIGLTIVLLHSRLFGMGFLWRKLLPGNEWRMIKTAIEESNELLGYLLILFSALLLRFRRKKSL